MAVSGRTAVLAAVALWGGLGAASGQVLNLARLTNGTELVVVTEPLASATSLAWPVAAEGSERSMGSLSSGALGLAAAAAEAFAEETSAPPVVVAVGQAPLGELEPLVGRLLAGRSPAAVGVQLGEPLAEGGVERRLGAPGSAAALTVAVPLPPPGDPRRSDLELVWQLVPAVLAPEHEGLRGRVEGDRAVIEARLDPDLVDLELDRLRLGLARLAASPELAADLVDATRKRLEIRRRAVLEEHPAAARRLVGLWLRGGEAAVRQFLFGLAGITVGSVRDAAESWLPLHPGAAVITLPPRALAPRFPRAPRLFGLDNDISVALLERPATELAVLCVRPVLVPDLDGELSATVLARLAAEIRRSQDPPGWVRVRRSPPVLELAAAPDGFAELAESVARALLVVGGDEQATPAPGSDDVRRRALRMLAASLGLDPEIDPSPARILRADNLALGVVVRDAEAAAEALEKLLSTPELGRARPEVRPLATGGRRREATPGSRSALALALGVAVEPPLDALLAELLRGRLGGLLAGVDVDLLRPLVPGRPTIVVVLVADGDLGQLEGALAAAWPEIVAPVAEDELAPLRQRVASSTSTASSGALGEGRRCAAVAAGVDRWRPATEGEMAILTSSLDEVNRALAAVGALSELESGGAGMLPIGTGVLGPDPGGGGPLW